MNLIAKTVEQARTKARRKRRELFLGSFRIDATTTILDLGSEDGKFIHELIEGTAAIPSNVTIADIKSASLERGAKRFGFNTCLLSEDGQLPLDDKSFDIVFSNSAIEHVTVPKEQVWCVSSSREFRSAAWRRQQEFAAEIMRVGRGYFVQTPYKGFIIESHSWLPAFGWLPRRALLPALRLTNRYWVKKTAPDWALLNKRELRRLFPDATIVSERFAGMTKSIIAVRNPEHPPNPD